jgi:hypothetical protein
MRSDYTHVTVVLDSSGSMASIKNDTIGGFNTFLEAQKQAVGKATFTFVQFSSGVHTGKARRVEVKDRRINLGGLGGVGIFGQQTCFPTSSPVLQPKVDPVVPQHHDVYFYAVINDFSDIQEVNALNDKTFVPHGGTPLLDSIGWAIDDTGERLSSLPESERPSKVLFVIITDGEENASQVFNYTEIQEKIKHQTEAYSWDFMYLGANQDAIAEGSKMGISGASSLSYAATGQATHDTYAVLASKAALYRGAVNKADALSSISYSNAERAVAMGELSIDDLSTSNTATQSI